MVEGSEATLRQGRSKRARRRGQGATEYVIVVGLIALGTITAVKLMSSVVGAGFGRVAEEIEQVGAGEVSVRSRLGETSAPRVGRTNEVDGLFGGDGERDDDPATRRDGRPGERRPDFGVPGG